MDARGCDITTDWYCRSLISSPTDFTRDPAAIRAARQKLARIAFFAVRARD
jgi:hypothetical protein